MEYSLDYFARNIVNFDVSEGKEKDSALIKRVEGPRPFYYSFRSKRKLFFKKDELWVLSSPEHPKDSYCVKLFKYSIKTVREGLVDIEKDKPYETGHHAIVSAATDDSQGEYIVKWIRRDQLERLHFQTEIIAGKVGWL